MPHLKPWNKSPRTSCLVCFNLISATTLAVFMSDGCTLPLIMRVADMYLPCLGSHLARNVCGSKLELQSSATAYLVISFCMDRAGAYEVSMYLRRGNQLVSNSARLVLIAPQNLSEAVSEETACALSRFILV